MINNTISFVLYFNRTLFRSFSVVSYKQEQIHRDSRRMSYLCIILFYFDAKVTLFAKVCNFSREKLHKEHPKCAE